MFTKVNLFILMEKDLTRQVWTKAVLDYQKHCRECLSNPMQIWGQKILITTARRMKLIKEVDEQRRYRKTPIISIYANI